MGNFKLEEKKQKRSSVGVRCPNYVIDYSENQDILKWKRINVAFKSKGYQPNESTFQKHPST